MDKLYNITLCDEERNSIHVFECAFLPVIGDMLIFKENVFTVKCRIIEEGIKITLVGTSREF